MSSHVPITYTLMLALLGVSCSHDAPPVTPAPPYMVPAPATIPNLPIVTPNSKTLAFWDTQQQHITSAHQQTKELQATIENLLQQPSAATLKQSQEQWQQLIITLDATTVIQLLSQQIPFPASQKIQKAYKNLGLGPAHLGYLDDDGQHGKTGLIFDIDTPINVTTLKQQQQLTSLQDLTLGASPLGTMLMGINGERASGDFVARSALNNDERINGFSNASELAENRRRELILIQSQTLTETVERLLSLWQSREHHSIINAFSQLSEAAQTAAYLQAALTLSQQQLEQLKHDDNTTEWTDDNFKTSQQRLHYQRWQAQQQGVSESATAAQLNELKTQSETIQALLQELIDAPKVVNTSDAQTTKTGEEEPITASTSTVPTPETDTAEKRFQLALESLINNLSKTLDMPPENTPNNLTNNGNSARL